MEIKSPVVGDHRSGSQRVKNTKLKFLFFHVPAIFPRAVVHFINNHSRRTNTEIKYASTFQHLPGLSTILNFLFFSPRGKKSSRKRDARERETTFPKTRARANKSWRETI